MNEVTLYGGLGRDPEVRYTQDNNPIANLNLATEKSWKDKNTGEKKKQTEWHRVVVFGGRAKVAEKFLKKGSKVLIRGYLRTRKWTGQDGKDNYTTEVVVDNSGNLTLVGGGQGQQSQQTANDPHATANVPETTT